MKAGKGKANFILEEAIKAWGEGAGRVEVEAHFYSSFNFGDSWGHVAKATPRLLYRPERDPLPILKEFG